MDSKMDAILQRLLSSAPFLAIAILLPVVLTVVYHNSGENDLPGIPFIGKEFGGFRKMQKAWMANGRGMMRIGYFKVCCSRKLVC
jgi:hypothetical protein